METLLEDRLRLFHKILLILFIPVCLLITIWYGWIGYCTLTERPGLNGDWYYYYQLTRPQFYIYTFTVALIAFGFAVFQILYLVNQNPKKLTKTFLLLIPFIALLIAAEAYLETRRIYKG